MTTPDTIVSTSSPIPKLVVSWTGFGVSELLSRAGIHNWGDAAGMAATVYSLFLIGDWLLKKYRWMAYRRNIARLETERRGN